MNTDKLIQEAKRFLSESTNLYPMVQKVMDDLYPFEGSISLEQDRRDTGTVYIYGFVKGEFRGELGNGKELTYQLKRAGFRKPINVFYDDAKKAIVVTRV